MAMKAIRFVLGGLLAPFFMPLQAQVTPKYGQDAGTKLRDLALAVPAPYAADAILRLADLFPGKGTEWKEEQIERAFQLAGLVLPEFPITPVPIGFTDSVSASSAIASKLQVDRLSLQIRAARAMLLLDERKSREMFESIPIPQPEALTCRALAVPDLTNYYDALIGFAEKTFSSSEMLKGRQEAFLAARIGRITSPLQVFPAVAVLADVKISADSRLRLMNSFAASLAQIRGDDRSFTVSFLQEEASNQLRTLVRKAQDNGLPLEAVLDAFFKYYRDHLRISHCEDTGKSEVLQKRVANAVNAFNDFASPVLANHARLDLPPTGGEYKPAASAPDLYKESVDYRRFLGQIVKLESNYRKYVQEKTIQRETDQLIDAVDSWRQPPDLDRVDVFVVKTVLLFRVLRLTKDSDNVRAASGAFVRFAEEYEDLSKSNPALWLRSVQEMLRLAHLMGQPYEAPLLSAFNTSRNPVLNLYAGLHRLTTTAKREAP